jgi:hypothetical protein
MINISAPILTQNLAPLSTESTAEFRLKWSLKEPFVNKFLKNINKEFKKCSKSAILNKIYIQY